MTNFRSVADLAVDTAAWSRTLPADVDLVVGLPRSGMLAASLLALHMDLPLVDIEGYAQGRVFNGGMRVRSRHGGVAQKAIVVDDSVRSGRAAREAREMVAAAGLSDVTVFGAVYVTTDVTCVDHWLERVPVPRVFEWNVLHHDRVTDWCMDADGVLFPESVRDSDRDQRTYPPLSGEPLVVPGHTIGSLFTSRPEQFRPEVEAWLADHDIRYRSLIMLPRDSSRSSATALARHKAKAYRRTDAHLFLEGDPRQAALVACFSGRSVYCTSSRQMVQPSGLAAAREQVRATPGDLLGRVSARLGRE